MPAIDFSKEELEFLSDLTDVAFEGGFRCEEGDPSQEDVDISRSINDKVKQAIRA